MRQALEVVRRRQFVGHAHAAVQLHRLLADEARGLADPRLGRRHRAAAFGRRRRTPACTAASSRHRAGLLELHEHVGHAVLQRLEFADRHAELLARLQVLERGRDQRVHRADALRRTAAPAP